MRLRYFVSVFAVGVFSGAAFLTADEGTANAQISLTAGASQYTQDFSSLMVTGSTNSAPYADNSTIPGFYALVGRGPLGTGAVTYTPTIYGVTDGGTTLPGITSFGSSGSTNRAFGTVLTDAITAPSSGFMTYGFRFINNDPTQTITQLTVQYTGEQWRRNSTTDQTLAFSSAVFDAGTGGLDPQTGYSSNTSLDFISTGGSTTGGTSPIYTTLKNGTITATVRPGQEFWVRWVDVNDAGPDHATAIDNVSVTAAFDPTPAPPAYISGLIGSAVGFAQFSVVQLRRKRRLRKK